MSAATYHGELYGVTDLGGTFHRVPKVALGSVPGVGLVTAANRAELDAGYFFDGAADFRPVAEVFYKRRRGPPFIGTHWRHAVVSTAMGLAGGMPVFRHQGSGAAARACAMPGEFICDG